MTINISDRSSQELDEINDNLEDLQENKEEEEELIQTVEDLGKFFSDSHVMSEYEQIETLSKTYNINATDARKLLPEFPNQYLVEGNSVPTLIKQMRVARRKLQGEYRDRMSKSIDSMIDAYTTHLNKCLDSILWVKPYSHPLKKMGFNEKDLLKLNAITDLDSRRNVVDSICKYWEASLKKEGMAYGKEFSTLEKEMRLAKKAFKEGLVSDQKVTKSKRERIDDFIIKTVCENAGINTHRIHDMMPSSLHKSTSPTMISKSLKKLEIVSVNGNLYKLPANDIKKNIWAYTAAFIDSDGYITLDRNMNPRVGLVATGERGRAFMEEMHKSIGFGRMHLDQKSPQDTRLINRLNFYSQADVSELLTKCLPHFRLKKGNAKLLLELIRMKKSYKKADWYKQRCDEIFKLMKWENHKDHVGFDWSKEGIYLDDIAKLQGNCKMSVMDSLEQIGGNVINKFVPRYETNQYLKGKGIEDKDIRDIVSKTKNILDRFEDKFKSDSFDKPTQKKAYLDLRGSHNMWRGSSGGSIYNIGIVSMRKNLNKYSDLFKADTNTDEYYFEMEA